MAITLVLRQQKQNVSADPQVFSALTASTAGNFLVAVVTVHTGLTITTVGVTDSGGNTWTKRATQATSGSNRLIEIWTARGTAAMTSLTLDLSGAAIASLCLYELSGVDTTQPIQATSQGSDTTADTTADAGSLTALAGSFLIYGVVWTATTTITASAVTSGYTIGANLTGSTTLKNITTCHATSATNGVKAPQFTTTAAVTNNYAAIAINQVLTPISGTDTGAMSVTEAVSGNSLSGTDTGAMSVTEAASLALSGADTGALSVVEAATVATVADPIVFVVGMGAAAAAGTVAVTKDAAVQDGDLLVCIVGGSASTSALPAGFTQIDAITTGGGRTPRTGWRIAASEPASWTFTGSTRTAAVVLAFRNVDSASPIDVHSANTTATSASLVALGVTTSVDHDALVFAGYGLVGNGITPPSGFTEPANADVASATTVGVEMSYRLDTTPPGATGDQVGTFTSGTAQPAAFLIALRPLSLVVAPTTISGSDTAPLAATDTAASIALTTSDTAPLAATDTAASIALTGSDTSLITGTDAVTRIGVAGSDTSLITGTDAAASIALTGTDASLIAATEGIVLDTGAATKSGSDTSALAVSENAAVVVTQLLLAGSDTGAMVGTGTGAVVVTQQLLTGSDTAPLVGTDTGAVAATIARSDTAAIASSESASLAATISGSDTSLLVGTDAVTRIAPTTGESVLLGATDAVGKIALSTTDTAAIASTTTATAAALTAITGADSSRLGSIEIATARQRLQPVLGDGDVSWAEAGGRVDWAMSAGRVDWASSDGTVQIDEPDPTRPSVRWSDGQGVVVWSQREEAA